MIFKFKNNLYPFTHYMYQYISFWENILYSYAYQFLVLQLYIAKEERYQYYGISKIANKNASENADCASEVLGLRGNDSVYKNKCEMVGANKRNAL